MPREFGGQSPLGKEINRIGTKQEGVYSSKTTTKSGRIVSYAVLDNTSGRFRANKDAKEDGIYRFQVKLGDGRVTSFLQYEGSVNDLTARFGHPGNFINKFCQVTFSGTSSNRGNIVSIVDDRMDATQSGAANQLQITGSAFAPPGGGMV